ncbi:type II toxin-antitoxin system VapB family antitoxin [Gordonia sp. CPCC 206044]|uniref:type II toxin-antitoxin system VapB family antitoxin n=1 Tax=Gordonia sp. CPCC 206044 TaxID=3140793 RepID=UPI003AF33A48
MIFKGVREGKPYPEHGFTARGWAKIPPRQFRLDELTTVTTVLALDRLLSEDSTFYGDLFSHVVRWQGVLYLEDGLHRAVRSALRNRHIIHARMLDLDALDLEAGADALDDQIDTARLRPPTRATVDTGPMRRVARSTGWTLPPDS